MAWLQLTPFSYFSFMGLWLGYILAVDGLNFKRRGSSPLTRAPLHFLLLFVLSAPTWWLFEHVNAIVQNWHYLGSEVFGDNGNLMGTLFFSTVIPAVFETTELIMSFHWTQRYAHYPKTIVTPVLEVATFVLGWVGLLIVFINPIVSFALVWLSFLMILDPLNAWLGRPSLMRQAARGNWQLIQCLGIAGVICGFFWEMWNFYSYPKWYYTVPFVDFWKIFEMPLLGYTGYIPFAMELYAIYQCVYGLLGSWMRRLHFDAELFTLQTVKPPLESVLKFRP
jgi:hypothetical protein